VVVWTPPEDSDQNKSSDDSSTAATTAAAAAATSAEATPKQPSMMAGQVPEDLRVGSVPAENAGVGATVEGGAKPNKNKVAKCY